MAAIISIFVICAVLLAVSAFAVAPEQPGGFGSGSGNGADEQAF